MSAGSVLRSAAAVLVLPGIVAGLVPRAIVWADPWRVSAPFPVVLVGLAIAAWGVVLLARCVVWFHRVGRGTLAPWDPPRELVERGPYARVRNPMYVAVLRVVAGLALAAGSPLLGVYAAVLAGVFHARVVLYEEPQQERRFGAAWETYREAVPRWSWRA